MQLMKQQACISKNLSKYWSSQVQVLSNHDKMIRFDWKTSPIPYASFFWDCSQYSLAPVESHSNDGGKVLSDLWS